MSSIIKRVSAYIDRNGDPSSYIESQASSISELITNEYFGENRWSRTKHEIDDERLARLSYIYGADYSCD